MTLATVVARQNWLFGAQTKFDLSTNEIKNTHVAFGRQTPDYHLHAFCVDGKEYGASWYHKVQNNVELGAQLGWLVGDQNSRFALASKYKVRVKKFFLIFLYYQLFNIVYILTLVIFFCNFLG